MFYDSYCAFSSPHKVRELLRQSRTYVVRLNPWAILHGDSAHQFLFRRELCARQRDHESHPTYLHAETWICIEHWHYWAASHAGEQEVLQATQLPDKLTQESHPEQLDMDANSSQRRKQCKDSIDPIDSEPDLIRTHIWELSQLWCHVCIETDS